MALRNRTFPLQDADVELLDGLAAELGCSKTNVIRLAMRDLRRARGHYDRDAGALIDGLATHGDRLTIRVELAGTPDAKDATVTIDGHSVDVEVLTQGVVPADAPTGAGDLVDLYLAAEPDLRIYVGRVPAFAGAELTVGVGALRP